MQKFKTYFISILIPVLVGGVVGFIISKFIDYNFLIKPDFAPPSLAFPIVWTILYVLMGISYGILKDKELIDRDINQIYYAQLVVNALWSIIFFVFKWRFFAILWTLLLVVLVAVMIYRFYKKDKISGLLQLPYLIWSLFATYLTIGIYILN